MTCGGRGGLVTGTIPGCAVDSLEDVWYFEDARNWAVELYRRDAGCGLESTQGLREE